MQNEAGTLLVQLLPSPGTIGTTSKYKSLLEVEKRSRNAPRRTLLLTANMLTGVALPRRSLESAQTHLTRFRFVGPSALLARLLARAPSTRTQLQPLPVLTDGGLSTSW